MSAAIMSEKTVTMAVRRLERATRPRTPDSGVFIWKLPRAWAPWTMAARRPPAVRAKMGLGVASVWAAATSAPWPVASSPQRSSRPTMMKLASREEPPWLMKGRVTPVRGSSLVTPPTIRKAWTVIAEVRPTAVKAETSDLARAAVERPRTASRR